MAAKLRAAELHTVSLGRRKPVAGALGNHLALVFGNGRQHANGEPSRLRHVATDKINLAVHQIGNERHIPGQPIEYRRGQTMTFSLPNANGDIGDDNKIIIEMVPAPKRED
jgi:hypothetical protein